MSAQELLDSLYQGAALPAIEAVEGIRPLNTEDCICDCGGDGECCGY